MSGCLLLLIVVKDINLVTRASIQLLKQRTNKKLECAGRAEANTTKAREEEMNTDYISSPELHEMAKLDSRCSCTNKKGERR